MLPSPSSSFVRRETFSKKKNQTDHRRLRRERKDKGKRREEKGGRRGEEIATDRRSAVKTRNSIGRIVTLSPDFSFDEFSREYIPRKG